MEVVVVVVEQGGKEPDRGDSGSELWARIIKNRQNNHVLIYFPTSEGVSEVSERANE